MPGEEPLSWQVTTLGEFRILLFGENTTSAKVLSSMCSSVQGVGPDGKDAFCAIRIQFERDPVPEPPAMLACGLVLMALAARRRRGRFAR